MAAEEAEADAARFMRLRNLAVRTAQGKFVLILSTVVMLNLLRIVSSMVLTRLLDAEAFGVTGFILSVTFVFAMVSDLGIFAFVVRHRDATDPRFLDEVWTIRLIRSLLLAVIVAALASPIAHLLGKPQLTLALAVSGSYFIGEGISSMAFATAVRSQQLRRLATMDVIAAAIQLPVSIGLALWLHSYWALIFGNIAGSVLKTLLSYWLFAGSARHFRFSRARMIEMWGFSRFIAGSSILTMVVTQSDKIALTRLMSLEMFGFYSIATALATAPAALVQQYCNRVIYPYFAALWREAPDKLAEHYYARPRKVRLFYTLAVGAAIGLAPLAVEILYDHRYSPVASYLAILLISPCLAMNNTIANEAMVASGRVGMTLTMNIVRALWLLIGGIAGYTVMGTMGLVIAVGTIEVGAMLYSWSVLMRMEIFKAGQEMLTLIAGGIGYVVGSVVCALAFHLLNMLGM
jgi:O-antigen/teichoic acid export membrane protein